MQRAGFFSGPVTKKVLTPKSDTQDAQVDIKIPSWFAQKVISGGQTGADYGGLLFAEKVGIPTGGWAPKGWRTESDPNPELGSRFHLKEAPLSGYHWRTEQNVIDAQATIVYSRNPKSAGTLQTVRFCFEHKRDVVLINPADADAVERTLEFLKNHQPQVLNIAGNRGSVAPGIDKEVVNVMMGVLKLAEKEA